MRFKVEIVEVGPPGSVSDPRMSAFELPDAYSSPEMATDAANAYIERHYEVGRAYFNLLDPNGQPIR